MPPTPTPWSLQTILEFEMEAALDEVREWIPGPLSREDARAHHIKATHQEITETLRGVVEVHTTLTGVRRQDTVQRFERYIYIHPRGEGADH